MRSQRTLRHWIQQLLPTAGPCAQQAAWDLVRALLLGATVELSQLARSLTRHSTAKVARQYLARWLAHPAWQPAPLYAQLTRLVRRHLRRQREVLLLVDTTFLQRRWVVLQVSLPWQGRALPLYRLVVPYTDRAESTAFTAALGWLRHHLPGPRRRYVLVLDRGFARGAVLHPLCAGRWRFVLRLKHNNRVASAAFTGRVSEAPLGPEPQLYPDVLLGWHDRWWRGAPARVRVQLVCYRGPAHAEPWYLATSETSATAAVGFYRRRMQIEQEFRDLKGPLALERLARWESAERVARLLAWIAVYEWRLAYLWLYEHGVSCAQHLQVGGRLSWHRTVREWLRRSLQQANQTALACL